MKREEVLGRLDEVEFILLIVSLFCVRELRKICGILGGTVKLSDCIFML